MSDVGPPPTKRTRHSARHASANGLTGATPSTSTSSRPRYILRSNAKPEDIVKPLADSEHRRKRPKYRIQKLMHLNDDCLLTIFEHMDPNTLSHIAAACSRLSNLARYHFRIKHSDFTTASLVEDGSPNLGMMMKILKNFGDLITSLHLLCYLFVQTSRTPYDLLKLVKRHCPNLKTLKLEDFTVANKAHKLKPLFQNVETLVLDNCTFSTHDFGAMKHLKMLKIEAGDTPRDVFTRNFPKLEQVEFVDMETFDDDSLMQFVNQNPALKRLSIVNCEFVSTKVFAAIGQLKQLEELEFHQYYRRRSDEVFQSDLMQLASMGNLKVLKLNCTKMTVSGLLEGFAKNKIPIEHMELVNGRIDDETNGNIHKLKTIKTLCLNEMAGLTEHHLLGFVKELKSLEKLHINTLAKINRSSLKVIAKNGNRLSCLKIDSPLLVLDSDTYQDMLTTIQKRDQNIKLDLTIYGDGNQLSVAESLSKGPNEKWLTVKELNRIHNPIFPRQATPDDDEEDDDDEFDMFDDETDEDDFFERFEEFGRREEEEEEDSGSERDRTATDSEDEADTDW